MRTQKLITSALGSLFLPALAGCASLGPMPATTGVSYVQERRPDVTLQAGFVPGYYLSGAVKQKERGAALGQIGALVEPDHWLSVPGLIVGARRAGSNESKPSLEPLIGYRTSLDAEHRFNAGGVGYATYAQGSNKGASYEAMHGGAEGGIDARVTPESNWLELHVSARAALTALRASGSYCSDAQGQFGVDCQNNAPPLTSAHASGIYPSVDAGVALDFARHLESVLHGGRLAADVGAGTMPVVVAGGQRDARAYAYGGVNLTLGLGSSQ